jgi:hypothetical protein
MLRAHRPPCVGVFRVFDITDAPLSAQSTDTKRDGDIFGSAANSKSATRAPSPDGDSNAAAASLDVAKMKVSMGSAGVMLHSAGTWRMFFDLLLPKAPLSSGLRIPMVPMLLLNKSFVVHRFFGNDKCGVLSASPEMDRPIHWLCKQVNRYSPHSTSNAASKSPVAVVRLNDSDRAVLVTRQSFNTLMQGLQSIASGSVHTPSIKKGLQATLDCFCIQPFISPLNDARYVCVAHRTKTAVSCRSFKLDYWLKYTMETAADHRSMLKTERPVPVGDSEMLGLKLRRCTLEIANHIQRSASLSLSALALEWVVADTETEEAVPHVIALLGTQWQGEATASWVRFREADSDSDLLCRLHSQMPPCTPSSGCARGRGPGFNHSCCGSECLFKLRLGAVSANETVTLPQFGDWLKPDVHSACSFSADKRALSETWGSARSARAAPGRNDWLEAAHDSRRASIASTVRCPAAFASLRFC